MTTDRTAVHCNVEYVCLTQPSSEWVTLVSYLQSTIIESIIEHTHTVRSYSPARFWFLIQLDPPAVSAHLKWVLL
jgi:hypothetical protein